MKRNLPPMNSWVTFEAAARLQSFKAGGEELNITSSAVSHQIRRLEDWLGFKLFERSIRAIALTGAGRRYFNGVTSLLKRLEKITQNETTRLQNKTVITLQTTDSIATRWLIPRLPEIHRSNPELTVKIITNEFHEPFRSQEADIGILTGKGKWQQAYAQLLFKETIFPVCHPGLFQDQPPFDASDFNNVSLIHDDNLGITWDEWFHAALSEIGIFPRLSSPGGLHYNHSHLSISAAEQGSGIALAYEPLVRDAISDNRLMAPFETTVVSEFGYYLVIPNNSEKTSHCETFCNWLLAQ